MINKVTKPMKELNRFEEEQENKTGLKEVHLLHSDYKWIKKVKSLKNAALNNISVRSWRSVLLMEETGENY
jgi:hypothetical protein